MKKHSKAPFLKISKMDRYFDDVGALKGIDLEVEKGEWVSIMGPSGSGKTTLLSCIGGLLRPTKGSIEVNGTELTKLKEDELSLFRRENIGLIFQQHHLIPYLSAVENIMIAQFIHSMSDEVEAEEAMVRIGLGDRLRHLPSQLSGGEQQRVCIARALINDPLLLLADEPTGNLDRKNSKTILEIIRKLHNKDAFTIVLVTHDDWVASWGQRAIKLDDGRILEDKKIKRRKK